jgi:hypothetical protein
VSRLQLVADRDGVAHAQEGSRRRTLCGRTAIDERFAWPRASVCPDCAAAMKERAGVPATK